MCRFKKSFPIHPFPLRFLFAPHITPRRAPVARKNRVGIFKNTDAINKNPLAIFINPLVIYFCPARMTEYLWWSGKTSVGNKNIRYTLLIYMDSPLFYF